MEKNKHSSLELNLPKPLMSEEELQSMARKHLLTEVNRELLKLTNAETEGQQIISLLEDIRQTVNLSLEQNREQNELKMSVLQKLKSKLETV